MVEISSRAAARKAGFKRYFTGEACPHGHVAERQVKNSECVECARLAARRRHQQRQNDDEHRAANASRSLRAYNDRMTLRRDEKTLQASEWLEAARRNHPDVRIRSRDEAAAAGEPRFFVGQPCRRGHIAERATDNGGCVECKHAGTQRWRSSHDEALSAYYKLYYAENAERQKEKTRRYHAALADDPAYRKRNASRTRAWIKENPNKHKANIARRRAREAAAEGDFTAEDVARIRKDQRDRCGYCAKRLRSGGELDHIRPLVPRDGGAPGTNTPSNLQLLCRPCNRCKHNKDPIEFARANGLLL